MSDDPEDDSPQDVCGFCGDVTQCGGYCLPDLT